MEDDFGITVTELEEEQVPEIEHFLVEDVEEALKACSMCTLHKPVKDGVQYVCGTYKARNAFAIMKENPPIEDTFWCSEFNSID